MHCFKSIDEESRAAFLEKASEDKDRYNKEMESYVPPPAEENNDDEDGGDGDSDNDGDGGKSAKSKAGAGKKKKVKKDPNAPKRPMASYFLWMGDIRESVKAENPEATIGELGKLMGAKWKELCKCTTSVLLLLHPFPPPLRFILPSKFLSQNALLSISLVYVYDHL